MVRNDGCYVIYILQYWCDMFNKGPEWHYAGDGERFCGDGDFRDEPRKSFTACGEVWQQTGIHGTFDKKKAIEYMMKCAEATPDRAFRIATMEINQRTTGICEMNVAQKGKIKKVK